MNWVCSFSLIPVIQFIEIVLGVLWLVEVCHIRRQVRFSVVYVPLFFLCSLSREQFSNWVTHILDVYMA